MKQQQQFLTHHHTRTNEFFDSEKKIQALAKTFPPTDGRRMYNGFELRGWKNRRKSQILSAQSGDESLRVEFELYEGGLKSASLLSSVSISNNCVVKVIHSISVPTFYANIRTQPSQRPSKLGNKKLSLKIFSPFLWNELWGFTQTIVYFWKWNWLKVF